MTHPIGFLEESPDELGERLLQIARHERAPRGARERALAGVAAASVGAAVATSTPAALAAPSLMSGGGLLAAKWVAIGLGSALVGLTAFDQAGRAFRFSDVPAAAPARSASSLSSSRPAAVRTVQEVAPTSVASSPSLVSPTAAATPILQHAARAPNSAPATPEAALAPSVADFTTPSVARLAREVAALKQARAALADGKPGRALEILEAYRRDFPVGVLGTEQAALRVELAFALGDAHASELAERFLTEHATSPLAARVRALLAQRRSATKP